MRDFNPECTLPPNGTYSGFVHRPNIRSTLEIVWSCISIIILSTWSSLHLNIPANVAAEKLRERIWKKVYLLLRKVYLLLRKVFWMGLKLFSPEFAAPGCATTIFATRSNSAMLEKLAHLDGVPWSLKHTMLVDMGGIALRFLPMSTKAEAGAARPEFEVKQRILKDRNKIPLFIKAFCRRQGRLLNWCGKIPWDLWENHVEHASHMEGDRQPSPTGELQTTAESESQTKLVFSKADVAALAGNIWILDSKQLAIARKRGIIERMPDIKEEAIDDKNKSDSLVKILAILQVSWLVVQLIVRTINNLHFAQLEITAVAFGATAILIYSIDFTKPQDINVPFYMDMHKVVGYDDFVAIAEAAPITYMQSKRYYMPTSSLHDLIDYRDVGEILY